MIRKLLLSIKFLEKMENINNSVVNLTLKQIEKNIIDSINRYNPKIQLNSIEYVKINDQFDLPEFPIYAGVIVEDITIPSNLIDEHNTTKNFIHKKDGNYFSRKVLIYVFISDYISPGRNVMAQIFFPLLIDLMGKYINSPSFTLANHPIYFINFLGATITQQTILKQIFGVMACKIEHIEVFVHNPDLADQPRDLIDYLIKTDKNFTINQINYSNDFFEIDFKNKIIVLKVNKFQVGDYITIKNASTGKYAFNGSSEKFYWIEVFPIIFLSFENNFKIDYSLLENFYKNNIKNFSPSDSKFKRFDYLLQFIKKSIKGK